MDIIMIIVFLGAIGFFVYNSYQRLNILRKARPDNRFDKIGERIKLVFVFVFGQKRLLNDPVSGITHLIIFWGFIIIAFGAVSSVSEVLFGYSALKTLGRVGNVYLVFFILTEMMVSLAAIYALYRRLIVKPKRLTLGWDGLLCLLFILILMITDMASRSISAQSSSEALQHIHMFILLGFLNYLPFSKHFHLITALPNVFFRSLEGSGKIKALNCLDQSLYETETQTAFAKIVFSWKHFLDLLTCAECGRCDEQCPAFISSKLLSPQKIIKDFQRGLIKGRGGDQDMITPEEFWGCTTCGACENACPLFIEHIQKIIDARRFQTMMKGELPEDLMLSLNNVVSPDGSINRGNPYGRNQNEREDWVGALPVTKVSENRKCDILLWVGCGGAFDARIQKITKKFAQILLDAGINFGILGKEELCCGEWIRRIGNEFLYKILVERNIETLEKYDVKEIVTFCPHCFNAFKNEYSQFGGGFKIWHHTQFISKLIRERKFAPQLLGFSHTRVVYHDPCYLGRHNDIYDEPREILNSHLFTNIGEIKKSRELSFCCGGGGGHGFMDEKGGRKINEMRLEQLLEVDPNIIATSCPFCLTMLDNALKAKGIKNVEVKDVIEI